MDIMLADVVNSKRRIMERYIYVVCTIKDGKGRMEIVPKNIIFSEELVMGLVDNQ